MRFETATSSILALIRGDRAQRSLGARFIGLAIASVGPALFWVGALALASHLLGAPLSSGTLGIIGAVIALFLCVVCAPLMLRIGDR